MWWAGSELSEVYLGQSTVGVWLRADNGAGVERWSSCESASEGWIAATEWISSSPRGFGVRPRARLWLSGALARPFMFGPVAGLKKRTEAEDIASNLAPDATGLDGPCAVWLNGWWPGVACVAIAVQRSLRDDIERLARRQRVHLTRLAPWWVAVIDAGSESPERTCEILSVEDTDSLTVLTGGGEALNDVVSYSPAPPPGQLAAVISRRIVGAGLAAARVVSARLRPLDEETEQGGSALTTGFPFAVWTVVAE